MEISPFIDTFLEEADDLIDQWENIFLEIESDVSNIDHWNALFRVAHTFKGSSKAVGLNEFGDYIHVVEDLLTTLKLDPSKASDNILGILSESFEIIREWIDKTKNGGHTAPEFASNQTQLKISLTEKSKDPNIENATTSIQSIQKTSTTSKNPNSSPKKSNVLRINIEKIDKLMQLIGEISTQASIVFHHKKLGQLNSRKCLDSLELLEENLPILRDLTLELRMETLEKFFQRMQKIANDVARKLGKKINVVIEGKGIELDKTIVDRIVDPFIHIVRNAVDHGIENSNEREKSSKNPIGTITLKAKSNGNQVEISVQEDGCGMDHEKLIAKALEKNLIPDKNITRKEALQLILKPGFSTAEKVTDVSGRGVGMDVVSSTIGELGGSLVIDSTFGFGSTFTTILPASVAIVDSFIIKNENDFYVIPRMEVVEVLELSELVESKINGKERVLQYREKIVPVVNLGNFISTPEKNFTAKQAFLVSEGEKSIAIEVDQIAWQQEVVARKIIGSLSEMMGVTGFTILSDGEPSLILSLKEFAQDYFRNLTA